MSQQDNPDGDQSLGEPEDLVSHALDVPHGTSLHSSILNGTSQAAMDMLVENDEIELGQYYEVVHHGADNHPEIDTVIQRGYKKDGQWWLREMDEHYGQWATVGGPYADIESLKRTAVENVKKSDLETARRVLEEALIQYGKERL